MLKQFLLFLIVPMVFACSTAQSNLTECNENQVCITWEEAAKDGLKLELNDSSLKIIEEVRLVAIEKNKLTDKKSSVPGILRCGSKEIEVSVRLKGDHVDHLKGNRWSFRVKTKHKGKVFGEQKFSIQGIHTRSHINEWIFHQLLAYENIAHLQYGFIPFQLNDIDSLKGIYAFESHFESHVLAIQNRKLGPIVKFSEDLFWDYDHRKGDPNRDSLVMLESELKLTNKKGFSKKEGKAALQKLDSYRKGKIPAREVFNFEKFAKYIVINGLVASTHAIRWHNLRFYLNPETGLFEPLGFDCGTWFNKKGAWFLEYKNMEAIYAGLYTDNEFMKILNAEAIRLSKKEYLNSFFEKNKSELAEQIKTIQLDDPEYKFWKVAYYNCQKKLREELPKK